MSNHCHIFFHCYAINSWAKIVKEQLQFFSGLQLNCTFIGNEQQKFKFLEIAASFDIKVNIRVFTSADTHEHEAMVWLSENAKKNPSGDTLYFHTKGVTKNSILNLNWRNYLNQHFLFKWQNIYGDFKKTKKQVAGLLYTEDPSDRDLSGIVTRYFAGNFWISSNEYLNQLPDYATLRNQFKNERYLAERYIGIKNPNVFYLDQEETLPIGIIRNKIDQFNESKIKRFVKSIRGLIIR